MPQCPSFSRAFPSLASLWTSCLLLTQPWAAPLCLHLVLATIVSGVVPSESRVCLSGGLHTQPVVGRLCKFPLSRDCLALSQGLSQFALAPNLLFLIGCLSPLSKDSQRLLARGSALIRDPLLQASSLLSLCVPQCSASLFLLCALSCLFHLGWVLLIGGHHNSKMIDSLLLSVQIFKLFDTCIVLCSFCQQ
jgi:hypothetical protein